jgi:hypothetical protein
MVGRHAHFRGDREFLSLAQFRAGLGTAALIIVLYILAGIVLSGASLTAPLFAAAVPQILLAVLTVPVAARLVASLDRARLRRWRVAR